MAVDVLDVVVVVVIVVVVVVMVVVADASVVGFMSRLVVAIVVDEGPATSSHNPHDF